MVLTLQFLIVPLFYIAFFCYKLSLQVVATHSRLGLNQVMTMIKVEH